MDSAGNPIVSCCKEDSAQLYKFSAADLSAAPATTAVSSVQIARGMRWTNGALYMTISTPYNAPITASGSCNYRDDVAKFTEDANGALVAAGTVVTLLTPCASGLYHGAGFTDVTQDLDGNFWVTGYFTSDVSEYSSSGQLIANYTGLNHPNGVEYVYAPEPASMAVLGLGVAGLVVARRRNKR